jgi:hypothetical protein
MFRFANIGRSAAGPRGSKRIRDAYLQALSIGIGAIRRDRSGTPQESKPDWYWGEPYLIDWELRQQARAHPLVVKAQPGAIAG